MTLLAVPNFSEGRDPATLDAIGEAFANADARVLNLHVDRDHNRSVFSAAGAVGRLAEAVLAAARVAVASIDVSSHDGVHPRVGALDVAPIVYLADEDLGAACAEALVQAELLGSELEVPVFLYGDLGGGRTRADLRRGGPQELARRIDTGELIPDFGPPRIHPTAGAVLVSARPPLLAFNVELERPASLDDARRIAALIREGGPEGLPAVRAIGLALEDQELIQVSTNIEDYRRAGMADVIRAVGRHARVRSAELVALAPAAAFADFPDGVELRGFDPGQQIIERALES